MRESYEETFFLKNQVCEILNEREVYREEVDFAEHNYKEQYSDMPCVGSRVRRGCHWNYENQDNHGVGTVIGHSERGQLNSVSVLKNVD